MSSSTWEYAKTPETAAVSIGTYKDITVEKVDDFTVRSSLPSRRHSGPMRFVSAYGDDRPKHLFKDYVGAKSREAPHNLKPVGTGPCMFVDFKPGDMLRAKINPNYHVANRPHFDEVEVKGGGDAVSAARAVLQTGEAMTMPGTCRSKTRSC